MFKTFPEFSKLTLADRDEYESYIKGFPPLCDISFAGLMTWWNIMDGLAVSLLNGNLVISYWIPGDEEHSGLSLVGTNKVDESACIIFDYLSERGEKPRLVFVPEFVVSNMQYPDIFAFKTSGSGDEYLVSTAKYAHMDALPLYMRTRARRFQRVAGAGAIRVKEIDISKMYNRLTLLDAAARWPLKGVNNLSKRGREALPDTLGSGASFGVRCVGLYVSGTLQAYCVYFLLNGGTHAVTTQARVNYDVPYLFEYMLHAFAAYFFEQGVAFANLYTDIDSQKMRAFKLALQPDRYLRKYTIEPI